MKAEKLCLCCGATIRGRADKKYCNDHCRSNYNYSLTSSDNSNLVRLVNNTLKKNRGILQMLNVNGKTKVWKKSLIAKGFDFGYHTNIYETEKRSLYYFCYDMGYLLINDVEVLLVAREIPPKTEARRR